MTRPGARFLLTELISGAMARLTAKLEAHEDHADEHAANRDIQARYDATPQGEQMQLAELASRERSSEVSPHSSSTGKKREMPAS